MSGEVLVLHIRTQHNDNCDVEISSGAFGHELVAAIRQALPDATDGKRVRLIYSGKLIAEDKPLSSFNVRSNAFIQVALSDAPAEAPREASWASSVPARRPTVPASEVEEEGTALRGFDRLEQFGISREQVDALRMTYWPELRELDATAPEVQGESPVTRMRRLEDEWMAAQAADSEFALNIGAAIGAVGGGHHSTTRDVETGAYAVPPPAEAGAYGGSEAAGRQRIGGVKEFACGFTAGSILGFIALLFLLERSLTRAHRLGMMAGLLFNLWLRTAMSESRSPAASP